LRAQSLLTAGAAAAFVITAAALTVEHFQRHAAQAISTEVTRDDPLPLCRGGDRTTNIASNED
jgi:hypothetical protein